MHDTHHAASAAAVRYGDLDADDTGGDERPPLVLLHGLTFDRRIWQPVVDCLRSLDADRRIVAFDLPGHGRSKAIEAYDFGHLLRALERAFDAADITAPVLVGHSMAGGLVSLYGAHHYLTAIVNVDQPPDIRPFAELLRSLQDELRSEQFPATWQLFADSFHTELLPDAMRSLVEATTSPTQERMLSYWEPLLATPLAGLAAQVDQAVTAIAERGTPYTLVLGSPLPSDLHANLRTRLPQIRIEDWSPSSHFPHLAYPARFAELLVEIAR